MPRRDPSVRLYIVYAGQISVARTNVDFHSNFRPATPAREREQSFEAMRPQIDNYRWFNYFLAVQIEMTTRSAESEQRKCTSTPLPPPQPRKYISRDN